MTEAALVGGEMAFYDKGKTKPLRDVVRFSQVLGTQNWGRSVSCWLRSHLENLELGKQVYGPWVLVLVVTDPIIVSPAKSSS